VVRLFPRLSLVCLSLGLLLPAFSVAQPSSDLRSLEERIAALYREHVGSMVRVKAVYAADAEDENAVPQVVIGTGFFISREGMILTNASIVSNPLRVWIEHANVAYSAELIGLDDRANIAFLRTNTLPDSFSFFHLGDSSELPEVARFVLRLSMPLELGVTPDFGLVSGHEGRFGDRFFPCKYIRTNIPAGPGDGGSAYLDLSGRLIGIQVGSLPDIGASYALPARAALRLRDEILFSGEVTYGWLGFEVDIDSTIEHGKRLVLGEIFADSPAGQAGLIEGDILQRIGDYTVTSLGRSPQCHVLHPCRSTRGH
jgi:S1-C subfamily serine protease